MCPSRLCRRLSPLSRDERSRALQGSEKVRHEERLESVSANRDDLALFRVQRHTGGAGESNARTFEDRARRNVAVVVGAIHRDESHPIQASLVSLIVAFGEILAKLVEHVGLLLLHLRVLLGEKDVAGGWIDGDLTEMRQLRPRTADERFWRDVAVRQPLEDEEARGAVLALAA